MKERDQQEFTLNKRKQWRNMNIIGFAIMVLTIAMTNLIPIGRSEAELRQSFPNLVNFPQGGGLILLLALIFFAFFTRFQAGNMQYREHISARTVEALGWLPMGIYVLYSLASLTYNLGNRALTLFFLILTLILLLSVNANIREDYAIEDEKVWVRNSFSLFTGWVLAMLTNTIAKLWHPTFMDETASVLLIAAMLILLLVYSLKNHSMMLVFSWLIYMILIARAPQSDLFKILGLVGIVACLVLLAYLYFSKKPAKHRHKHTAVKRPKFNHGEPDTIEALEEDLNHELSTDPSNRIHLDK